MTSQNYKKKCAPIPTTFKAVKLGDGTAFVPCRWKAHPSPGLKPHKDNGWGRRGVE